MSTFKEFEKEIEINGVKVTAVIEISVEEDYDVNPGDDFDFGNTQDNAEYLARFKSGELFIGLIRVTATAVGEEGLDILGSCHLYSNNEFNSKPFENSVNEVVELHVMVEQALADLEANIVAKANQLKKFA